jgi:nicotinate dehydrogenase subunit B
MSVEEKNTAPQLDREDFLKAGAAAGLVVYFAMPGIADAANAVAGRSTAGPYPEVSTTQLDSWVAINTDGTATIFSGKNDNGQGVPTAFRQIAAEELDLEYEKTSVIVGDSLRTLDQGGASSSTAVSNGGIAIRNASAEARRVLVELAATKLGAPASSLIVENGVVYTADRSKKATYGELLGGQKFNVRITSNSSLGNNLSAVGLAKPKDPKSYKIVGKSVKRDDIAEKVFGSFEFIGDVKVPGMLHARIVRPQNAGAKLVSIDGFPKRIPGVVKVLAMGKDAVAVVAEREENAVKAAQTLRVKWSNPATPPFSTHDDVYNYIRGTAPRSDRITARTGDVDKAIAGAAKVLEATYEWPFQSHSSMAPSCSVADYKADGTITVWSGTQKTHRVQRGIADLLGLAQDQVRTIYVQGAGSYGRNDADDVALEAAWLSKQVGRPVRLQWMRHEGIAWDPKGPASVNILRGGLDKDGNVVGVDFNWKGFSGQEVGTSGEQAGDTLIGMSLGRVRPERNTGGSPEDSYAWATKRVRQTIIPGFLAQNNPLRSTHIRDPQGPQSTFASEQFVDELAVAAGQDPVAFRLKYLSDPRHIGVVKAVAERYRWDARVSGSKVDRNAAVFKGRGISYQQRGSSVLAMIADVEVTRKTGKVWLRKMTVACDAGLIVNPDGMANVIEGNVIHATSRTLKEEVRFTKSSVTSVSWETYPILNALEMPEEIDIVYVNNEPGKAPGAAGEPPTRPVPAAIANAFFDATGVRLRRVPFTPTRVRAALQAAGL